MTAAMADKTPNPLWTALEGRSVFEWGAFFMTRPLANFLPKGDGHPVIVYPGFLASEFSTRPLRGLLRDLNYEAYDWGMGRNLYFTQTKEVEMSRFFRKIYLRYGRPVTLIGWSLGGVYAREIAKANPGMVRQVISLGSPVNGPGSTSGAKVVFETLNGKPDPELEARLAGLSDAPPAPYTSIYSKTDGIVHWTGSLQKDAPQTENIQIPASHLGIGTNPLAMYVIADRLAQKEGEWKPFDTDGLKRFMFKTVKA